jgi:hypothetical protein
LLAAGGEVSFPLLRLFAQFLFQTVVRLKGGAPLEKKNQQSTRQSAHNKGYGQGNALRHKNQ